MIEQDFLAGAVPCLRHSWGQASAMWRTYVSPGLGLRDILCQVGKRICHIALPMLMAFVFVGAGGRAFGDMACRPLPAFISKGKEHLQLEA